jgi:hypothetical protein
MSPETVILVEDETDLLLFPPLRAGWTRRGEPAIVLVSGRNARRVVWGVMNLKTGQRTFAINEHQRSIEFQALLQTVRQTYGSRSVALILDEDSSHTAKASTALAIKLDIQLLWLPNRTPKLNPMEGMWGHGKDHISANSQRRPIDEQAEEFVEYLESLTDYEALKMAGVLSKNNWLKSVRY